MTKPLVPSIGIYDWLAQRQIEKVSELAANVAFPAGRD
jgi:hypothetical protein